MQQTLQNLGFNSDTQLRPHPRLFKENKQEKKINIKKLILLYMKTRMKMNFMKFKYDFEVKVKKSMLAPAVAGLVVTS